MQKGHSMNSQKNIQNKNKEKSPERVAIVEKISEFEKLGKWSIDVEADPPTIPLTVNQVDYLKTKLINKILSKIVTQIAWIFIKNLVKTKKMIVKEIRGIENYLAVENQGCLITCNHFNPFDNFCIHYAILPYLRKKHKDLWVVIREGNYTNFPGFYGLIFRQCHTLPLSSNLSTMKKFMDAMKILLSRGEKVLIYPEQAMWWNYKKPRPLVNGAFKFAAENNSPVLPMFITMEDSNLIGDDGFPIQEYTLNILPAIFPDKDKTVKQNTQMLKDENYEAWKKVYEDFYKTPLTYETKTE